MITKRAGLINSLVICGALAAAALLGGRAGAAGGDSNADADGGFHKSVDAASAVMIRVPVNDKGQENTSVAEMRLIPGTHSTGQPADFVATWNSGTDLTSQPRLPATSDSDTRGRWGGYRNYGYGYGWNNWYGNGWANNYYYNYYPYYYYYPSDYSYPYYYSYSYPYYYNYTYGYGYPYYGYNYYYYPAYYYGYGYGY